MYKVETNDSRYITNASKETLRKAMFAYLRKWQREGKPLAEARFMYGPVRYIPVQELQAITRNLDREILPIS